MYIKKIPVAVGLCVGNMGSSLYDQLDHHLYLPRHVIYISETSISQPLISSLPLNSENINKNFISL